MQESMAYANQKARLPERESKRLDPRMTHLQSLLSFSQLALLLLLLSVSPSAEASKVDKVLTDFVKWLQENGVSALGYPSSPLQAVVEPMSSEDLMKQRPGIHVVANRDIKSGETIFSLPQELLVNSSKVIRDGFSPQSAESRTSESGWYHFTAMAAWLLTEKAKGKDSFFAPYINILPSYVPLPVFYDEELLKQFEYETILSEVPSNMPHWLEEYKRCDPNKIANATFSEFSWAMSILYSRSFSADDGVDEDAKWSIVLLPLADLLDHEDLYQAQRTDSSDNCTFVALSDISKGAPVYTTYGGKASHTLAMSYGFVLKEHAHDEVVLYNGMEDVLTHYVELADVLEFDDLDKEWARHVAQEAQRLVESALENDKEIHRRENFFQTSSFTIRSGAQIDPRLIATIAAIFLYKENGREPLYTELVHLSMTAGADLGLEACEEHLKGLPLAASAMQMVLYVIHKRVFDVLYNFSTTYEEDYADLNMLQKCKVTPGAFDSDAGCKEAWKTHVQEWQTILGLRLAKKSLLRDAGMELEATCWGRGDPDLTEGFAGDEGLEGYTEDAGAEAVADNSAEL